MRLELTVETGGAGGEALPPPEAPQGAGYHLTAVAATPQNHLDGPPP